MILAIATDDKSVGASFRECEGYTLFEIADGQSTEMAYEKNPGSYPGMMKKFLEDNAVDTVISGSAGPVAQSFFKELGVIYILGADGSLEDVVNDYLNCELKGVKQETEEAPIETGDEVISEKKDEVVAETEIESPVEETELVENAEDAENDASEEE
ncbi:NifB/NifX family molybdenum-iron cluster-binding protein [Elusimicrobiota bacterium]